MVQVETIAAAWLCGRTPTSGTHGWADIGAFVGLTAEAARKRYSRYQGIPSIPCPICTLTKNTGISARFEVDGNYAVAESQDGRIRTLPDLLAASKVDLSVWKVRDDNSWGTKAFEGYAADEYKNLTFVDGKITGTLKRDGIITETLFSVWASFVRIVPEPLVPTVRPIVSPNLDFPTPSRPSATGVSSALIVADAHIGFRADDFLRHMRPCHNRQAMDLVVQAAARLQPDAIIILGDLLDMPMFSDKFIRHLEFERMTQPAIIEAHWWLRRLREACPKARIELHQGNHEQRIERSLLANFREACHIKPADELQLPPSMSVPRLLSLHKMGIEWVGDYPDDVAWLCNTLQVLHGAHTSASPLAAMSKMLKQTTVCRIVGHGHSAEMAGATRHDRDGHTTIIGHSPGCLCQIGEGGPPGETKYQDWQNGMTLAYYADDMLPELHFMPIDKGKAIVNGAVLHGSDSVDSLRQWCPEYQW
jgi:hypothetical protein